MTTQDRLENTTGAQGASAPQSSRPFGKTDLREKRQTRSVTLSPSRWLAYVTAGIASGFGLASTAEGEIHYSGLVNAKMEGVYQLTTLPLSGGASLKFGLGSSEYPSGWFLITGAASASARAYTPSFFNLLANIDHGSPISIGRFVSVAYRPWAYIQSFLGRGYFRSTDPRGFIGFKFDIGKGAQYGWARLEVQSNPGHLRYIIKDYAWGDPGDPIAAGQHKSFDQKVSAMPKAGSLGLLAVGAAGLEAWRNARAQTPTGN